VLVALLPAHNEGKNIVSAIEGLQAQTSPPDQIIVVADNCTDDTATLAYEAGATVFETVGNRHKKAGGLNQVLSSILPALNGNDVVLIQDADSILDSVFIENALPYVHSDKYGAVGGVFRGEGGNGFVGHLQRNEYARYARDVRNLGGLCLVITGTAALFRADILREVSQGRLNGTLPAGDARGGVYDTTVLTEDNEITFAVKTLGYDVISPKGCYLVTEIMPTWTDLWHQRLRWKRGAVENCLQYGLTKITWRYWGRQFVTLLGVIVTLAYLATIVYAVATWSFNLQWLWLAVTAIFMVERAVTVSDLGIKQALLSLTMYEIVVDFFLQAVHAKAFYDVFSRAERNW
jgi:poly-beta-1,6-N-acetyl-D-glucosamine synthase